VAPRVVVKILTVNELGLTPGKGDVQDVHFGGMGLIYSSDINNHFGGHVYTHFDC